MLPLLPAVIAGGVPGSPHTDLYPALWGLGWFADHVAEGLPTFAPELAAPAGMPFYFSSPLHGWAAAPLVPLVGVPASYTIGLVAARIATVLCAYGAGRALFLHPGAALVLAAVYGCAPYFHGHAVEGIIEGTDGWALALWVWMAARQRWAAAAGAAALVVLSSWYLAMAGLFVAVAVLPWRWRATASFFAGLAVVSPALIAFLSSFPAREPLDAAVRAAMGTSLDFWARPGVASGLNPFAKTSWIGLLAPALAAASFRRHPWLAAGTLVAWVLSLGIGPWWDLPGLQAVRFPYRLHAATLLGLGLLAARTLDDRSATLGRSAVIALAIVTEGLLLSPIEPVLPVAPIEVPASFRALEGKVVLSIPGPVAMPPGQVNPSRERARYVLYWGAVAGTRTPWAPDFNAVGAIGREAPVLDAVRSWDPLTGRDPERFTVEALRAAGIDAVVVHRDQLGELRAAKLREELNDWIRAEEGELIVASGW